MSLVKDPIKTELLEKIVEWANRRYMKCGSIPKNLEIAVSPFDAAEACVVHTSAGLIQLAIDATAPSGSMASMRRCRACSELYPDVWTDPRECCGACSVATPIGPLTSAALKAKARCSEATKQLAKPIDPLDVEYDGWTLRNLLEAYESSQREGRGPCGWAMAGGLPAFTTAQRAAVSSHWSAELRAKVAASAERERNRVLVDVDGDE